MLFRLRHLVFLLPFAVATLSAEEWPLTGALNAHDPSIIKEERTWWCFTTGAGLRVKSSPDGLNWTQGASLFEKELDWWRTYAPAMRKLDVWAPDIQEFGGRVWCYYTISEFGRNNSAIGLKSCTSLAKGDWRDDGFVIGSKSGVDAYNAIDASLTTDAAGNPWLVFGSWFDGIQIVRLDQATMKPTGEVRCLARRANGIEAPNIIYTNGHYYLFISIDKCCQGVNSTYKIVSGRADAIIGPYTDRAGVKLLESGGTVLETGGERWKGPGGQDVYQNGSAWLIARHAYDANNHGKPALLISDLFWDLNNWPTFATPVPAK
jgi:arabinan endo-1,5-alpha-L-arabinosidase